MNWYHSTEISEKYNTRKEGRKEEKTGQSNPRVSASLQFFGSS